MQTRLPKAELDHMASIKPFQAWRYNTQKVSMEKVIAPPYDVISPGRQDRLYETSPYNCIRLILNRIEAGDDTEKNRYGRARDDFEKWKKEGVLVQDPAPFFYLYRQTFPDLLTSQKKVRTSLLACLKLEDFEKGIVLPHEKTLDKPKKDRRMLLETTRTIFSPIFGLYQDPDKRVREILSAVKPETQSVKVSDEDGVFHEFIPFDSPEALETLEALFSEKKIYIADGHHRYTTALEYSRDRRKKENVPDNETRSYDYIMAALVAFEDAGLAIYPTHRIVKSLSGFDPGRALEAIKTLFDIEPMTVSTLREYLEMSRHAGNLSETLEFGMLLKNGSYLVRMKSLKQLKEALANGKPDIWYGLDVNVLGYAVFKHLWKFCEEDWESHLEFTHDPQDAVKAIGEADTSAVFLLKSPGIGIVRGMCEARELMPQKSTYFYPKLASGFVFYQH